MSRTLPAAAPPTPTTPSPTTVPVPDDVARVLSPMALQALGRMNDDQRAMFLHTYSKRKRSVGAMLALAILFPIQLFLLGKTGLGVAFILTAGGMLVWWVVEWFLTPKRVREYNCNQADEILMQMRLMGTV